MYQAAINARKVTIYWRMLVLTAHMSQTMQKMAAGAMHSQDWQN